MDVITATHGESLRSRDTASAWSRMAEYVEKAGLNLTDTKSERLTALLRQAGYTSSAAPRIYTLIRLGLIFLLPIGYILLAYSSEEPPSFVRVYVIGSVLALSILVSIAARRRAANAA